MAYGIDDRLYVNDLPNVGGAGDMPSGATRSFNTSSGDNTLREDIDAAIDKAVMRTKQMAAVSGMGLAKGLHYVTGIDVRKPVTQLDVELNPLAYGEVRQTGPVARTTPTTVQPSVATTETGMAPMETKTITTTKEHPWTKFTSVDQAARTLNDADFKKFIDMNRDHPAVQGMGYIEVGTPGTKGYRLERTYPEPQSKTGYGVGGGKALSVGQMQGIASILNARNAEDLRRQHLDQLTTANWFAHLDRQDRAAEQMKLKRAEDFQKKLVAFSPSTPDDEKKPMINVGLLRLIDQGVSPKDMPGYEVQAETLKKQRDDMIIKEMKKKGITYVPADVNIVGTPTYNAWRDLNKRHEDALMNKISK